MFLTKKVYCRTVAYEKRGGVLVLRYVSGALRRDWLITPAACRLAAGAHPW